MAPDSGLAYLRGMRSSVAIAAIAIFALTGAAMFFVWHNPMLGFFMIAVGVALAVRSYQSYRKRGA
jgi:hypothetical protein